MLLILIFKHLISPWPFISKVNCLGPNFYRTNVPLVKAYGAPEYGWTPLLATVGDVGGPTDLDMTDDHSFYVQEIKSFGLTFKKISYFTA